MRTITASLSGLLLSAFLLLPASVQAAELQPFFTLKTSSINTLVSVAEKVAGMADAANEAGFREFVNTVKNIKGVNSNGIIGFAAAVDDAGSINMILLLPITDLWGAEVPGFPDIFDSIRPFLVKKDGGKFEINSPLGAYVAVQKQGYLVITPESAADSVPADPTKLFADLEKFTLGMKLDLEKVEFETIEGNLFGPLLLMAMMNDPAMGEQLEGMVEIYRELYNEFAVISGGTVFNPRTADLEMSVTMVPRKGSQFAKLLAGYKQQPTIFGGFRGTPATTVFSFGDSATQPKIEDNAMLKASIQQWESMLEGFREQIAMEDETGELSELAEEAAALILKILETESKKGVSDVALSMNVDGIVLGASDTASLVEIQKLAAMVAAFAADKVPDEAKALLAKNLNLGYATVEGFKISSVKIPVVATLELFIGPAPDDTMNDLTLGVFWGVKEGNKQAIAVAAGLDFAKAEQAFKAALTQTKTAVPVQKPDGVFSIAGLGKFLQQTVYPIAAKAAERDGQSSQQELAVFRKVNEIFTSAGNDATITINSNIKSDRMEMGYHVSGKVIQAIISAVKLGAEEANPFMQRPIIQDF